MGGRERGGLGGQVSGDCVICLVLSYGSKDLKWHTSVTVQLQLRVLFGKQRIVHPPGVRADWPQKRGLNLYWPPHFIHFVSSPLILPYANWASQEGVVFVSPEVLTLVCGFSFVPFCSIFTGFPLSLSFNHCHFLLLFPILTAEHKEGKMIFNVVWAVGADRTHFNKKLIKFSSVQSLSRVRLFATPWTAACQASLSFTDSQSLFKLMSIQPSHPLLSPSPPAFNISHHQGLFWWVSSSHQVPKILEFQLQHQSF